MTTLADTLRADAEKATQTAARLAWICENVLPKHHLEEIDRITENTYLADARVTLTAPDLSAGLTILERTNPCNIYKVHWMKGSGVYSFRPSPRVIDGQALHKGECADLCGPYLYHIDDYRKELQCFFEDGGLVIDVRVRVVDDPLTRLVEKVTRTENGRVLAREVKLVNDSGEFLRKIHWGGFDKGYYTLYNDGGTDDHDP